MLDWLRLARTPEVGPATFAQLIPRFGSASSALEELPHLARRGGGKTFVPATEEDTAREWEALEKAGGRLVLSCDPDFPEGLAALAPPTAADIGAGRASPPRHDRDCGCAQRFGAGAQIRPASGARMGEAGLVVVSGLARGIDSAAHEAALEHGTVAVVAGGVDVIYPPENEILYRAIVEQGGGDFGDAVRRRVPGAPLSPPQPFDLGSLTRRGVVEAAERSGSLITANYALEQGREIFAVPGSPLDPRAKGANRLIREGATLIESADDVLSVLGPILGRKFSEPETAPPAALQIELRLE
jgi:DNA processing protein